VGPPQPTVSRVVKANHRYFAFELLLGTSSIWAPTIYWVGQTRFRCGAALPPAFVKRTSVALSAIGLRVLGPWSFFFWGLGFPGIWRTGITTLDLRFQSKAIFVGLESLLLLTLGRGTVFPPIPPGFRLFGAGTCIGFLVASEFRHTIANISGGPHFPFLNHKTRPKYSPVTPPPMRAHALPPPPTLK